MKVTKKIRSEVKVHSRELFEALGIPNYEKATIQDAKLDLRRRAGEGYYFLLNIVWEEEEEDENIK